jgi:tRNA modification GTPase
LFKGVVKSLGVALSGLKQSEALELVAEELKNARSGLDEVVGKKFSDDLLGDIFRGYCIGK